MYECESGDIVEKDEYLCMYPVLGYGDLEADNIFLKKINNKIYIYLINPPKPLYFQGKSAF